MKFHLLANVHRPDALEAATEASQWLRDRGHDAAYDRETAARLGVPGLEDKEFGDADVAVAFGGDGTLIRTAHLCSERGTPILGVFFGRFGFVTQARPDEVHQGLERVIAGEARFEERMMLQADLVRRDGNRVSLHALNDVVLQRNSTGRMLTFEVEVDGETIADYPADGVIVSTPTGSTAYNLSAGGPILDPGLQAMILTAIAPHTLSSRSLIVGGGSKVVLRLETDGDSVLAADMQVRLHIMPGDEVRISRSPRSTRLVQVHAQDFYRKLSQHLQWSHGIRLGE